MYHQVSWTARILHFLGRLMQRVLSPARGLPGGWWALAVLSALAVLLIVGVLMWTGPVARSRRAAPQRALQTGTRSARDHYLAAQRLAQAGEYGSATLECVRAIAAELAEREVLPPRPGRTADEFAAEAGQALPAEAGELRAAAAAFDDICYGERPGTAAGYQRLAEFAARLGAGQGRARSATVPAPAGSRAS
jgi:hypothetical protein